jgi:hypothetical protein
MAVHTEEASYVPRYARIGLGASQDLVDLLGLLFQRLMAKDLQQLMEFRPATPQARLVGPPSHLEVALAVARAVEGQAQKRARLLAFPGPLGVACGQAAEGHQAGLGRLSREGALRQALDQHLLAAVGIGLVLETHDEVINVAQQGGVPLQPWLHDPLAPQIQHVVQGEVTQHNTNIASLRHTFFTRLDDAVFQPPSFQPPPDQAQEARLSNAVLPEA